MKVAKQWRLTAAVLAAIAFGGCTGPVGYDDTDRKVDSLLKQMTLDEKIGQMSQFSCNWDVTGAIMPDDYREYLRKGMVGSILNGYTVAGIRLLQSEALEHSRLKIPVLFLWSVIITVHRSAWNRSIHWRIIQKKWQPATVLKTTVVSPFLWRN